MNKSILLIGTFLSHAGGSRSICEDMALRLSQQNWQVFTASNHPARIPRLLDILTIVWKHRRAYRAAQIDVYSGPAFLWAEAAAWLLEKLNKPFILTLHGGNLPEFSTRYPFRVNRLLHSADLVTTPSRYLLETMCFHHQNVCLLPNPLDLSSYEFQLRDAPRPRLIWLRAFNDIYNPGLAPRVLAHLLQDFPNVCLTMVGPDKGDGSLQTAKRVAEDLGVLDRIELTGGVPKSDVPTWLNKGDVFINTTNVDNTPVSVIEAMACGLCVVSTDVGGIPYLLEHEHDALLVHPRDSEAMANAVRRIVTEPELGKRLSSNARKKAEQFDWSVILPQWENLLNEVSKI